MTNDMVQLDNKRVRAMLDANVLVAGIGWPRFAYEILEHALKNDFRLVLSPILIEEVRASLSRIPPVNINLYAFETFLANTDYELISSPSVQKIENNYALIRDPKDVHVVLAAIDAAVDVLVTQDKDFIDDSDKAKQLREQIQISVPGAFLKDFMGWTSERLESIRKRTWQDLMPK